MLTPMKGNVEEKFLLHAHWMPTEARKFDASILVLELIQLRYEQKHCLLLRWCRH